MCMCRTPLCLFSHYSSLPSAAELGLRTISIQKGSVSEGITSLSLNAGLTSLRVITPYLSYRS